MNHTEFLRHLDDERIVAAIRRAERSTTGEIRLCVAASPGSEVLGRARTAFARLGMHETRDRNGVLLYIVPASQQFAVVGDTGIHEHCGEAFWAEIVARMSESLASGGVAEGLEAAIGTIGQRLAERFPRRPGDANELPDHVATDE